jgi:hypothetical protein
MVTSSQQVRVHQNLDQYAPDNVGCEPVVATLFLSLAAAFFTGVTRDTLTPGRLRPHYMRTGLIPLPTAPQVGSGTEPVM